MIIRYRLNLIQLLNSIKKYWLLLMLYTALAVVVYEILELHWIGIPWQILTVSGTAVSFYLGFKNNSSYERAWEARKIWGAIVNSSRSWGNMVKNFIGEQHAEGKDVSEEEIKALKKRLVFRHIAWIYQLRRQLWDRRPWESPQKRIDKARQRLLSKFAPLSISDELKKHIDESELEEYLQKTNIATQLIAKQSDELEEAHKLGYLDNFRHVAMQELLTDFYTQQGKCERIKNFPFPRQYSSFSFFFVLAFILLLPLGLIPIFKEFGEGYVWLSIPFTALVGMIFWLMELVGDFAENPFTGGVTDTPMTQICHGIETDLKEMINEADSIGPKPKDVDGVML